MITSTKKITALAKNGVLFEEETIDISFFINLALNYNKNDKTPIAMKTTVTVTVILTS